jgi:hypothetical protein
MNHLTQLHSFVLKSKGRNSDTGNGPTQAINNTAVLTSPKVILKYDYCLPPAPVHAQQMNTGRSIKNKRTAA